MRELVWIKINQGKKKKKCLCGISSHQAKEEDDLRVRTGGRGHQDSFVLAQSVITKPSCQLLSPARAVLGILCSPASHQPMDRTASCSSANTEKCLHGPVAAGRSALPSTSSSPPASAPATVHEVWKQSIQAVPFPLGSCWQCTACGFPV